MRVEFHRPDSPDDLVGAAVWEGHRAHIEAEAEDVRAALSRVFRPTPIVVDDGAYRTQGTFGEVMLQPGSLGWFRAAALARASEEGLVARFVPGVTEGGWDPAAQHRTFSEQVERMESRPG